MITTKCCKCDKLRVEDAWVKRQVDPEERYSYTYCGPCLREFKREIWRERHTFRSDFVAHPQAV